MKLALLGDPVAHSKSAIFQNAGLAALGIDGHYEARRVDEDGLRGAARDMRSGGLVGCNITLPHKEAALHLADTRSAIASAMSAANTWVRVGGAILATNTDVFGVRASVSALQDRPTRRVIVLGAGGAAAAAAAALIDDCESMIVVNRNLARAERLCESLGQLRRPTPVAGQGDTVVGATACKIRAFAWTQLSGDTFEDVDLIVQGTSLPVLDTEAESRLMQALPWSAAPPGAALLELCYATTRTAAMRAATAHGLAVADGACMLLHQGAASLALWTDRDPPMSAMRDALALALARDPGEIPLAPMGAADWRRMRDEHLGSPG